MTEGLFGRLGRPAHDLLFLLIVLPSCDSFHILLPPFSGSRNSPSTGSISLPSKGQKEGIGGGRMGVRSETRRRLPLSMVVQNSPHSIRAFLLLLVQLLAFLLRVAQCGVTYDRKAIIINGQRRILISGSIHYPRSTPEVSSPLGLLLSLAFVL